MQNQTYDVWFASYRMLPGVFRVKWQKYVYFELFYADKFNNCG